MSAPIVDLFGDSTYAQIYLRSASNSLLMQYWGRSADYDGRLHVKIAAKLAELGRTVTVLNHAVPGWTAAKAMTDPVSAFGGATQLATVLASNATHVILNFGTNEAGAGTSKAKYKSDMSAIIDALIAADKTPILANNLTWQWGPTGGPTTDWVNSATQPFCDADVELAALYNLELIDIRSRFAAEIASGNWDMWIHKDPTYWPTPYTGPRDVEEFYADLHPWESGSEVMADEMATDLDRILPVEVLSFDAVFTALVTSSESLYFDSMFTALVETSNPTDPSSNITSVMDRMEYRSLDANFETLDLIESYSSMIWTDKYNEVGDFELHGFMNEELVSVKNNASYILNTVTNGLMVLETPGSKYHPEDGNTLTITGRSMVSVLDRRVIPAPITIMNPQDRRISQIICNLISDAFGPSDPDRHWDKLQVVNTTSSASPKLPVDVGMQFNMGDSLLEVVLNLCTAFGLGIRCEFSIVDKIVKMVVFEGVDRSVQGSNLLVFSNQYDNLLTSEEEIAFGHVKNAVLVVGNAEDPTYGVPKHPQFLADPDLKGLNRRETFLKADVDDVVYFTDNTARQMTDAEYIAALTQAGSDALNSMDNLPYRKYIGEIIETLNCKYGTEFSLGDIVAFQSPNSSLVPARLDGITFSIDATQGKTLSPSFNYNV